MNSVQRLLRFLAEERWIHYLLLALLATLLAYACYRQHWRWAVAVDNLMLDASFRCRAQHTPAEVAESLPTTRDIVMVELPHPVPRRILAQVLWRLRKAKVVALDLMLVDQDAELHGDEKSWYQAEMQGWQRETTELATAMHRAGNVIVGVWADETWVADAHRQGVFTRQFIWQSPASVFWQGARYHAHLSVIPDAEDRIIRRTPLFLDLTDLRPASHPSISGISCRLPSLGLAIAAAASDITPAQLTRQLANLPLRGGEFDLGHQRIRYEPDAMVTIDYIGDRQCFEYGTNSLVYDRLLQLYTPEDFAGKLVLIGGTDVKSKDYYPTPYGLMSGMQIHANIVATLRDVLGSPRVLAPGWLLCLGVCCCLLPIAPLLRWPIWSSLLIAVGEVVALVALGAWLFSAQHLITPISVPILALVLMYNALLLYEYSRACVTLEKFIGSDMVKRAFYLMTHLRLGTGRVEEAAAMFCDLRGFTTISETLPPETLAHILNEYTTLVVFVVKRFHGRPIDFAGDGVFILFEEALAGRHFPLKAVQAALALHAAFAQCRDEWLARGLPHLEIGMAIHTGRMHIGTLGSEQFIKLGATGDVVNVASRVQNLSTTCGFDLLITQDTYNRVHQEIATEYCGPYPIRGRVNAVMVYGVTATRQILRADELGLSPACVTPSPPAPLPEARGANGCERPDECEPTIC